jgi:hypothetical protein
MVMPAHDGACANGERGSQKSTREHTRKAVETGTGTVAREKKEMSNRGFQFYNGLCSLEAGSGEDTADGLQSTEERIKTSNNTV